MTDTSSIVAQLLYAQRQQVTLHHRHTDLVERGIVIQHDSNNDELIDLYTEQLKQSTAELRLLSELVAQIKKILSRRKVSGTGRNANSADHHINNKQQQHTVAHTPAHANAAPSSHVGRYASLSAWRSQHSSVAKQKIDIWTHDSSKQDLPIGLRCAALSDSDSVPKMWIVAQIVSYKTRPRAMYEVADIDSDVTGGGQQVNAPQQRRKTYILDTKKIIPLPTLDDIPMTKRKEFTIEQRILAVFPETTTLYPAYVVARPKQRKVSTYLLRFDDDDVDTREIDIENCVPMIDEFAE